jgi:hypothetical protein
MPQANALAHQRGEKRDVTERIHTLGRETATELIEFIVDVPDRDQLASLIRTPRCSC